MKKFKKLLDAIKYNFYTGWKLNGEKYRRYLQHPDAKHVCDNCHFKSEIGCPRSQCQRGHKNYYFVKVPKEITK